MSVRYGAKRHMPNLHTARPHLQSQSCGIAFAQFGGILTINRTDDELCAAESGDPMGIPFSLHHEIASLKLVKAFLTPKANS